MEEEQNKSAVSLNSNLFVHYGENAEGREVTKFLST